MNESREYSNHLYSYDYLLREGQRLNLLTNERFRRFLNLVRVGCARQDDVEFLQGLIANRQREMLESGLVVAPPSAAHLLAGNVLVGHCIDTSGQNPVYLSDSPPRPTLVIGSSGTGKTRLVSLITRSVKQGCSVVILDPRDDYTCLARDLPGEVLVVDGEKLPINIFSPDPGVPFVTNARSITSALADCLTLYHRGQNVIQDSLLQIESKGILPTVPRLLRFLRANPRRYSANRDAFQSVLDRFESLQQVFGDAWNVEHGLSAEDLLRFRFVIIRTQSLGRTDLRVTFSVLMLVRFFLYLRGLGTRTNQAKVLVVIDEAEYLLSKKLESDSYSVGSVTELIHQARAVGLHLLFVTQDPVPINKSLINDSGNLFVFGLREGGAQRDMVRSLGLPDEAAAQIASLPDRVCYLRLNSGDYRQPFLIRTLDWDFDDSPLSQTEIELSQAPFRQSLHFPLADVPLIETEEAPAPVSQKDTSPASIPGVPYRFLRFLVSVDTCGCEGVMNVYQHARLAPGTGKKLFDQSIGEGLVGSHRLVLPGRGGQRTTAFLTEKGREVIGAPPPQGKGGAEHVGYQHDFAYALEECGFEILVEHAETGKSIDLVHRFKDRDGNMHLVAIEIELSTKGLANVLRNLSQGIADQWLITRLESRSKVVEVLDREIPKEIRNQIRVSTLEVFLREYVSEWRKAYGAGQAVEV